MTGNCYTVADGKQERLGYDGKGYYDSGNNVRCRKEFSCGRTLQNNESGRIQGGSV